MSPNRPPPPHKPTASGVNPALIHDLAEASSHFATAAVNSLPLAAQLSIADKIAEGATFAVRVQLTPFRASVDVLSPSGEVVTIGTVE